MKRQYLTILCILLFVTMNCIAFDRTEAQRYYDLSLSYMKSGLFVKGLETLNQVAFLYPDSDIADDALYQLALLRERSGDGEISLGEVKATFIDMDMVNKVNLNLQYAPNNFKGVTQGILYSLSDLIVMSEQKKIVLKAAKVRAINEYISAIDYLNTAFERYPKSDISTQLETAYQRVTNKLDNLTTSSKANKQNNEPITNSTKALSIIFLISAVSFIVYLAVR